MKIRGQFGRVDTSWYSVPVAAIAVAVIWAFGPFDPAGATILSITVFCIALWIGNPVPPSYTGLLGIGAIGAAFSTDVALVGFRSPATWLVAFGLLMGVATRRSGLADWAGDWIAARSIPRNAADDPVRAYRYLLVGLCLAAFGLAFLVPSALVRILALIPVLQGIGSRFESREARIGLFLGPLLVTFYGAVGIFTAALPNIIITGIAESLGAPSITWTEWTTVMLPVMGLGRVLLVTAVVYALYRPDPDSTFEMPDRSVRSANGTERRMLLFLLVGTAVWMTDFVHGLHPVYGALLVVLLAYLPTVGVARYDEAGAEADFSILFFLGAIFAIGDGLTRTGLADAAATSLLDPIPADAPRPILYALVFGVTILLTLVMAGLAVASVLTPIITSYATQTGIPIVPVLMTEAIALGTFFFPYQAAPLVVILSAGVVDARELIRATTWCSILTITVLLPLQFLVFTVVF